MYHTHHFAHASTMARARQWLHHLGFHPERVQAHTDGHPRLTLSVEPGRMAEAMMLINAVERSDPDGWPGFRKIARMEYHPCPPECPPQIELSKPRSNPIGWHPMA